MKLQYLGDSKDYFKWSYLDFLISSLKFNRLLYIPMLTPDDKSNEGTTKIELKNDKIYEFCEDLKHNRNLEHIKYLPKRTNNNYTINIFEFDNIFFSNENRVDYLRNIKIEKKEQIIFFDPDNGFQSKSKSSEKHIQYIDILYISEKMRDNNIIVVFHHFRRKKFKDDFQIIKNHLPSNLFVNNIFWNGKVMFVIISKNEITKKKIEKINNEFITKTYIKNIC